MKLKEKNVLITGAAQGIGKSIAFAMAKQGANITIADTNLEKAGITAQEIQALGVKGLAIKLDVSNPDDVASAFGTFMNEFGRLDILVNNAGITRDALLLRMKSVDWDAVLNINLKGTFLCSKEAVRLMSKKHYGKIISISSVVAFTGNPGQASYSASKAGIVGLTKTIAKEYAGRGIRANAVAPGFIQTAMTDAISEKVRDQMKSSIPLGTFGTTEDVANAVVFLGSEESDYITGQVLHINGGMYM
ncbi:MAG TPA: 3-oxoacyl-[acyl-carrier-protein] reductase [Nitrospirae bacterium]|nr:3-oxoacyl-[acyl-carrier-protein] reductase FabG [bacterium BMS3Abin10]GBE39149.1 3-oxoacyl-[acyl-carrier-protein] reductase FabG [bacterium BMS3Bbin08]HDH51638.1 3-oxoacyl-[acyl-carrier-protein] reductase [Nitrospirota bacterium]HDK82081.1 3-oxoacyl-[acyl-carrier-protein] reductase [Nitrospirota bacterium]